MYVKNVQFEHEGVYRCVIRTSFSKDYRQGYLTVRGELLNEYTDRQGYLTVRGEVLNELTDRQCYLTVVGEVQNESTDKQLNAQTQ